MILSAHDKLSVCFADALISGSSEFHWPSFADKQYFVFLEYNGGLPILSLTDLRSGQTLHDVTAFRALNILELYA